jgi:hypothetical protein
MTVSYYSVDFEDPVTGERHYGSIAWDKYHPRRLTASIGRVLPDATVDYPAWSGSAANNRAGLEALILRLKRHAASAGLTLRAEAETKYAPKGHLGL